MSNKHVAILNRKSRSDGDTEETLRNHKAITRRLCKVRDFTYDEYNEVISGESKWEQRPELVRLLQNIEAGLYYAVVVVELARLARSGHYSHVIADTLVNNNVLIITPKEIMDLTLNSQRLLYDIQAAVNSNELRVTIQRMRTGMQEKAKRGEYVAAKAPYGYTAVIKDKIRTLRPNSDADAVKLCYNLAEKGYGMKPIVKELNLRGLRSSEGGKFSFKSVLNILHNKQYTGTLVFKVKDKKGNVTEEIEVADAFEAIITQAQFNKVKDAIKGRTSGDNEVRNRTRGEVRTILKDLLYCGKCSAKIGFQKTHSLMVKKCRCGMRGVAESRLLEAFWEELISIEKYFREQWEKALDTPSDVTIGDLKLRMDELQSSKVKLNTKLKRARDAYAEGIFTKEEYLTDKVDIEKELSALQSSIKELSAKLAAFDKDEISRKFEDRLHWIGEVRRITERRSSSLVWRVDENILPIIAAEDFAEVNRLLKLIFEKITYRRFTFEQPWTDAEGNTEIEEKDVIELEIIPR
jgi:site-specific DNA recombinase